MRIDANPDANALAPQQVEIRLVALIERLEEVTDMRAVTALLAPAR